MSLHTALLSVEEFLKLPEPQEGHIELHHGEVVVMPPPKKGHHKDSKSAAKFTTAAPRRKLRRSYGDDFPPDART